MLRGAADGELPPSNAEVDLSALRTAVRNGGHETAALVAERVLDDLPRLDASQRARALPLVVETLLTHGLRERAAELARSHEVELQSDATGATLLDVLVHPSSPRIYLPGGRLNAWGVSRRLDQGQLDPAELIDILISRRAAAWRKPELHLLMHTALRHSNANAANDALNRFLRSQSLCRCIAGDEVTSNFLGSLHFPGPRRSAPRGPLVSIVMAAHEAEATVGYAVDSLSRQTYENIEILACDDGSADGTVEVLRRRSRSDPRLRVFSSVHNQGPYNVRNALIERARGELIAFHDADDVALPSRIETQVRQLRHPGAVASVTNWLRVTPDGRFVFFRDQSAVRLALVSLMVRRKALMSSHPYRPARFGADLELYDWLQQAWGSERIARVRAPHIFGLWSESSLTRQPGSESLEDGYRAPARRMYSELLFRRRMLGPSSVSEAEMTEALKRTDNWAEPSGVVESDCATAARGP